jgi:group II intron reverse transcriptase/maturase
MMHGRQKSDLGIVAMKLANKPGKPGAESVERRPGAKGNMVGWRMDRTQGRVAVSQRLDRVRQAAKQRKKQRFTALFHYIDIELLRESFFWLQRKSAPGVDGVEWRDYEADLEIRLVDLQARLHRGAYRALPSRRQYIAKPDGTQRPLGIAALEDKIVQRAVVEVLNAVYEADFLGFSYGFRPGRSQHDALDALSFGIMRTKVNFIVDADVEKFFDRISHDWLMRFLEHRIGDPRILRLIRKWLKAGVMEDGTVTQAETGTPQGAVISPLLANVYLHYVFDLWAHQWRRSHAHGNMIVVRYADDTVVGFERLDDAERFIVEMRERVARFELSLHPQKTRLIEFGRHAASRRAMRGLGKPETFNFLGFTHICGRTRRGAFALQRLTRRDRMQAALSKLRALLHRNRHHAIPEQGAWLRQVLQGYFAYHAVPTNARRLSSFRHYVARSWLWALRRRSQKDSFSWDRIKRLADHWLPSPRILHPWPDKRFAVTHPRWEPGA